MRKQKTFQYDVLSKIAGYYTRDAMAVLEDGTKIADYWTASKNVKASRTWTKREIEKNLFRRRNMPRGDKSKYTDKQKRKAEHIEEGYRNQGLSEKEAESRAWATVNAMDHGGKKPGGSGRGKSTNLEPAKKGGRKGGNSAATRSKASRVASAKKASRTQKTNAKT